MSIENTKNAETWSFTLFHRAAREIEAGDRLWLLGKTLVVFSLSESRKIQGRTGKNKRPLVTSDGVQLTVGRYLEPEVTLTVDTD